MIFSGAGKDLERAEVPLHSEDHSVQTDPKSVDYSLYWAVHRLLIISNLYSS